MEVIFFSALLVSVAGNILSIFVLYDLLKRNVSGSKQLYNERKDEIAPFVEPMKEADQYDLSEVDDEVLKKAVKESINKVSEPIIDDEEEVVKAKEFMI